MPDEWLAQAWSRDKTAGAVHHGNVLTARQRVGRMMGVERDEHGPESWKLITSNL